MKIVHESIRISNTEMPPHLASLIAALRGAPTTELFVTEMNKVKEWHTLFGKTEMGRWAHVLDRCDEILDSAISECEDQMMEVDVNETSKANVLAVLRFTGLVFENTSSRSVYASTDRIIFLLDSCDMEVVIEVLHFLQVVSKRSRFLSSRLNRELQKKLAEKLVAIAECWGGRLRNIKLEECVQGDFILPHPLFPFTFTISNGATIRVTQPPENKSLLTLVDTILAPTDCSVTDADAASLLARLRLLRRFSHSTHRMQSLIARLLAMSTLLYSRIALDDAGVTPSPLPPSFIEETCSLLHLDSNLNPLVDSLKAEALRTLTAIISNDKPTRLNTIMEQLGASQYHGFLAIFTRRCVEELKAGQIGTEGHASVALCTALFSLLYHMSSMDTGARHSRNSPTAEGLVSCGITQTLLSVVSAHEMSLDMISFATRCVRVIDILSSIDAQGFLFHKGVDVCVARLCHEVDECRKEQPFMIDVSEDVEGVAPEKVRVPVTSQKLYCHHQRAALIKSLLNFLKRIINESFFGESFRRTMDGSLPSALMHIISNADYYSASLFHNALQLISNFVYQEPSQLSQLQQQHLPFVVFQSMLRKEIPASRDVMNHMAGIFTALCLNERGLAQFKLYAPFVDVFRILLSTKFIHAMKRKRSDMNESAMGIGQQFEELLRNHSSLRQLMLDAISSTLTRLVKLGTDEPPVGTRIVMSLHRTPPSSAGLVGGVVASPFREASVGVQSPRDDDQDTDSDDEDMELGEDEQAGAAAASASTEEVRGEGAAAAPSRADTTTDDGGNLGLEMEAPAGEGSASGKILPLGDYLLIFGRIVETLLTAPQTNEMVEGFLARDCLPRLLQSMRLPNLRAELAQSAYPQTVANILKHILQHSNKEDVLVHLTDWTKAALSPLTNGVDAVDHEAAAGLSLLSPIGASKLGDILTSVNSTAVTLIGLTRTAVNNTVRDAEVRTKMLSMWADNDSLQTLLHHVFCVLSWENVVIARMKSSLKVSSHTQTDFGERMDVAVDAEGATSSVSTTTAIDSEEHAAESVTDVGAEAADGRKQQDIGIKAEETNFWLKNKELLRNLIKAHRNVSELLGLLSKLCVGWARNSRRQYDQSPYSLTKSAAKLAAVIFGEYKNDLIWRPTNIEDSVLVSAYLSEVVQQLSSVIFDERRQCYHHLLSRFYSSGCYQSFIDLISQHCVPAISAAESPSVIDSSLESLVSEWFKLAARLTCKQSVLATRHKMTEPNATRFPINKFFTLVHMDVFTALSSFLPLLKREKSPLPPSSKLSEMLFSLLQEVTRNVVDLHNEGTTETVVVDGAADPVDPANIQRLVDMGFDHEAALQALATFRNVTDAAEFLIGDQLRASGGYRHVLAAEPAAAVDAPASPDVQADPLQPAPVAPAAALPAAPPVAEQPPQAAFDLPGAGRASPPSTSTARLASDSRTSAVGELCDRIVTLNWEEVVETASQDWLPLVLSMLGAPMQPPVYDAADLTLAVAASASESWKKEMLLGGYMRDEIIKRSGALRLNLSEESSRQLGGLLHFTCLVFEGVSVEYLAVLADKPLVPAMLDTLLFVSNHIEGAEYLSSQVLPQLLLWFDLYDKCTRYARRKALYNGIDTLKWFYFHHDDRYGGSRGKWTAYSDDASKHITKAFLAGHSTCKVRLSRREFLIDFIDMSQRQEVSGDRHHVCALLPEATVNEMKLEDVLKQEEADVFSPTEQHGLMTQLTCVLGKTRIAGHSAHCALSLVARLTRRESAATAFVEQGGVAALIALRAHFSPNSNLLLSLILRHCVEDDALMSQQFEKALRSLVNGNASSLAARQLMRLGHHKDWMSILALYLQTACRSPKHYVDTLTRIAKMDRNGSIVLWAPGCSTHSSQPPPHSSGHHAQQVLELLLKEVLFGEWTADDMKVSYSAPSPSSVCSKRMFTRSVLLQLAAELVKSYSCAAQIVAELKTETGQSVLGSIIEKYLDPTIDKDTTTAVQVLLTALASSSHSPRAQEAAVTELRHSLVNLLQQQQQVTTSTDNSTLAATPHSPSFQFKVAEIAYAISAMVTACPAVPPPSSAVTPGGSQTAPSGSGSSAGATSQAPPVAGNAPPGSAGAIPPPAVPKGVHSYATNAIVRLVVKKRLLNELMRCVTHLPLSKKESIDAANQVIRTIDDLAKVINYSVHQQIGPHQLGDPAHDHSHHHGVRRGRGGRGGGGAAHIRDQVRIHDDAALNDAAIHLNIIADQVNRLEVNLPAMGEMLNVVRGVVDRAANAMNNDHRDDPDEVAVEIHENPDEDEERSVASSGRSSNEDVHDNRHGGPRVALADRDEADEEEPVDDDEAEDEHDDIDEDEEDEDEDDEDGMDYEEMDGVPQRRANGVEDDQASEGSGSGRLVEPRENDDGLAPNAEMNDAIREEEEDSEMDDDDDMAVDDDALVHDDLHNFLYGAADGADSHLSARIELSDLLGEAVGGFAGAGGGHRWWRFDDAQRVVYRGDIPDFQPLLGIGRPFDFPNPPVVFASNASPYMAARGARASGVYVGGQAGAAGSGQHPLMQRPSAGLLWTDTGRASTPGGLGSGNNMVLQRLTITQGGRTRVVGLQRQNAVRRQQQHLQFGPLLSTDSIFQQIFEDRGGDRRRPSGIFSVMTALEEEPMTVERERRPPPTVPTGFERMVSSARVLDEGSGILIAIILNSFAFYAAKEAERKEAAAQDATRREKKKADDAAAAAAMATAAIDVAQAERAAALVEGASATTAPGQAPPTVDVTVPEPMDTSETAGTSGPSNADVSRMETEETEARSTEASEQPVSSTEDTTAAAEAPRTPPGTPAEAVVAAAEPVAVGDDSAPMFEAPPVPEEPVEAAPRASQADHEYRDILGDITIPDGVDPAFLAALPEDMRAEVLRDHERQQRVARLSGQQPAGGEAQPAQHPAAAGAAPSVARGVEPLDQDFLNALPPDLQEEILAQHERAVRQSQAAAEAAAAPVDENPAAVIQSLPPGLRAQVLSDADDTVLQVLPPALAEEARRLRVERGHQVVARMPAQFHRNDIRDIWRYHVAGGHHGGRGGGAGRVGYRADPRGFGSLAGSASTAPANGHQVLDRDAVSALILMLFMDARLNQPRLQRTLRGLCMHKASCDYLVYALLAILEKASSPSDDDDLPTAAPSWIDSITVPGVGHNERVLKIAKNGSVFVHPLVSSRVATNVLDLLVTISKSFPGAFVPQALRKEKKAADNAHPVPPFSQFWSTVVNYQPKPSTSKDTLVEHIVDSMADSPLSRVISLLRLPSVASSPMLIERVMRLLSQVVQSLPDDTASLLSSTSSGPTSSCPLADQLGLIVSVLTSGQCTSEALHDGRNFLVEAMRSVNFVTTDSVYELLLERIEILGDQLRPQIDTLRAELAELPEGSGPGPSRPMESERNSAEADDDNQPARPFRTLEEMDRWREALDAARGEGLSRNFASSCAELQLPSVRALTEKTGAQSSFLSALHTICKVRDSLLEIKEARKKRSMEEATKKYNDAKKKFDDFVKDKEAKQKEAEEQRKKEAEQQGDAGAEDVKTAVETSAETEAPSSTTTKEDEPQEPNLDDFVVEENCNIPELHLSSRLKQLDQLWPLLSACLLRLGAAADAHAVLALQPAAEAFFLEHAVRPEKARELQLAMQQQAAADAVGSSPGGAGTSTPQLEDDDARQLLQFAEKHRQVLNQVLRTNSSSLSDGPFAALALFPKLLDFDVKRKHFRKELNKMDDRLRYRREDVAVRVRRSQLFSDSFRELFRLRGNDWKARFYIMFDGEEGQDAGGLLREWFSVITREIFNPNYALFITAPGDRVTYMINKASYINPEHLDYFKFVGRIIAKAIHDNKLLDCYFTRAFYKHILNLPVRYQDMESEDPSFYKSLEYLLNNPIETLGTELTFSLEVEEFGVRSLRPLKLDGTNIAVTDENKEEYVRLVCQMKMTGSIRRQLDAFLEGFYEVIPKHLIAMFNEQELELLISGLPNVDIDDLMANTEYRSYTKTSVQIQWFWRALRSLTQEDRAKFLQFVTGTSKVPLQGFASLEGMNGVQKFSIHMDSRGGHRLPAAHTCFNQLDLPQYESYEKLRECLLLAIRECTEGFGFA